MIPEELESLRLVSIFRQLDDAELAAFAQLLTTREYAAKERIIEEGTLVTHFSIILDGTVHVRRLAQKREMLMGRLGTAAFFGEINLFDPGVATASLYAMGRVRVAQIDYDLFRNFMSVNPAIGYKVVSGMMTEMSRRLRQTSSRLVQTAYWSSSAANS